MPPITIEVKCGSTNLERRFFSCDCSCGSGVFAETRTLDFTKIEVIEGIAQD